MRCSLLQLGLCWGIAVGMLCAAEAVQAADTPGVDLALTFKPTQADVVYEQVEQANYGACKVEVERQGKVSGWVVFGPEGQVLRRFWDTNADNVVDQWRYYDRGFEVYRDMDTNYNNKVDQFRWLNILGTRWGIDSNEDGKVDQWKVISAEEASREAILAMAQNDPARLSRVMISPQELKQLGMAADLTEKLQQESAKLAETMRARLTQTKVITPQTSWLRFDSSMLMPYVIPQDEGKANQDLIVYENVMAIVETAGETGFVQMGEMLQIGQTWKLTQVPAPIEGDTLQMTEGGVLMQPSMASTAPGTMTQSEISPQMKQLLVDLQELDTQAPTPQSSAADLARYNSKRVELLRGLLTASSTEEERVQWLTQMIDGLAAAVQTGKYPEGARQLASIEEDLKRQRPNSELIPYTAYRALLAEYTIKLQTAPAENDQRQEIQTWWLDQLKTFVTTHPKSTDAADALLQLAITEEFSGNVDEAKKWYTSLATNHAQTDAGQRAQGALRRLTLEGKQISLKGTGIDGKPIDLASYRGKSVLVIFWATWCQPCTEDLPQIRAMYDQYRAKGLEIVGVNLDTQKEGIAPYIAQHGNRWPHIAEPQGLEGKLAIDFGIISVPTMFLINPQGQVVSNATSVEDLKEQLPTLMP
ncbi:MAG: redoxin domain-containing protein [Planctomycetaceae bacterium]|nr:redoxin domain-containing protein [Planctomycetaceae bacterium]